MNGAFINSVNIDYKAYPLFSHSLGQEKWHFQKDLFIYSFRKNYRARGRGRERGWGRSGSFFMYWPTPQMTAVAGPGSDQSQERGASSRSATRMGGDQAQFVFCHFSQDASRESHQKRSSHDIAMLARRPESSTVCQIPHLPSQPPPTPTDLPLSPYLWTWVLSHFMSRGSVTKQ